MSSLTSATPQFLSQTPRPTSPPASLSLSSSLASPLLPKSKPLRSSSLYPQKRPYWIIHSVTESRDAVQEEELDGGIGRGRGRGDGGRGPSGGPEGYARFVGRAVNAGIVLGFGTFAITKLLTIDHDYWHGWTLYEVLRYAPEHNWIAYEEALKTNPVLAKMVISGVVYSLGDWIAQCYEGKPLFEFDRTRMFRSGLLGFLLHGSLSHYYYQFCEALFPSNDWWVVPAKVGLDQTVWAAIWNSIYFVALGFLRLEPAHNISDEWKATFLPMLTAGWKLWPFAHLITYGVVPVEQRLLWVDCVELIWVTILSTYSNEKSEERMAEASIEAQSGSTSDHKKD